MNFWRGNKYTVEVTPLRDASPRPSREEFDALRANPMFQHLLGRLRAQHQMLKAQCATTRFDDIKDLAFVQSGVFWTGWLERDIALLTQAPPRQELPPLDYEEEEFNKIFNLLEKVGIEPQSSE